MGRACSASSARATDRTCAVGSAPGEAATTDPADASMAATKPMERGYGEWESPITSELITSAVSEPAPLAHAGNAHACLGAGLPLPLLPPTPAPLRLALPPLPLQTKRLGAPSFTAAGDLVWLEGRPSEKGRQVLVRRPAGGGPSADLSPPPDSDFNARTRVQE